MTAMNLRTASTGRSSEGTYAYKYCATQAGHLARMLTTVPKDTQLSTYSLQECATPELCKMKPLVPAAQHRANSEQESVWTKRKLNASDSFGCVNSQGRLGTRKGDLVVVVTRLVKLPL